MNDYSIEELASFIEVLPLNQINFPSVRAFLGSSNTNHIKHIQDVVSGANNHTCRHCNKSNVNGRFNIVPECSMIKESDVIQISGLKPLCTDCFAMHGILLKSISDNKAYTEINAWKTIIKCFKDFGGCSTSDISDTLDALFKTALTLQNSSFKWDMQYLFRRNIVDKPLVEIVVEEQSDDEKAESDNASKINKVIEEAGYVIPENDGYSGSDYPEVESEHYDDVGINSDASSI